MFGPSDFHCENCRRAKREKREENKKKKNQKIKRELFSAVCRKYIWERPSVLLLSDNDILLILSKYLCQCFRYVEHFFIAAKLDHDMNKIKGHLVAKQCFTIFMQKQTHYVLSEVHSGHPYLYFYCLSPMMTTNMRFARGNRKIAFRCYKCYKC